MDEHVVLRRKKSDKLLHVSRRKKIVKIIVENEKEQLSRRLKIKSRGVKIYSVRTLNEALEKIKYIRENETNANEITIVFEQGNGTIIGH